MGLQNCYNIYNP